MPITVTALMLMILGVAIHQIEGVFVKKYNTLHNKGGMIFIAMISLFAMVFFFITDKDGLCFAREMIPYAIASGVFYSSASFLTYVAYGCGAFMLTNLFISYSLLIPIGYGLIFLGDPATPFTYAALTMIAISIFLTNTKSRSGSDEDVKRTGVTAKWLICALTSALGAGMFGVMQKMQQMRFDKSYDNEFMIVTLGFSAVVLFTIGVAMNGKELFYTLRHGGIYAAVAGLSNGATNFINLAVNTMIPISIASPSRCGVTMVMSFLISLIVFKEKLGVRRTVGVCIGAAALILLNL